MNNTKYIGVIGARNLPGSQETQVRKVVGYLLGKGYDIASGGAIGADAFALNSLLCFGEARRGLIFSPWQQIGQFPIAVKDFVAKFLDKGGQINWGLVPSGACRNVVVAGLLGRNIKLASTVSGLVAFLNGESRGTIFTIRQAIKRQIPIVTFLSDTKMKLPEIIQSQWVRLQNPAWENAYKIIY